MAEQLMVFSPGERLATMTDKGKVRIYTVTEDGMLRAVTPATRWTNGPDSWPFPDSQFVDDATRNDEGHSH